MYSRDQIDRKLRRLYWLYSNGEPSKSRWVQAAIMKAKRDLALIR